MFNNRDKKELRKMGKIKSFVKNLFVAAVVGLAVVGAVSIYNATEQGHKNIKSITNTVKNKVTKLSWQNLVGQEEK